MTTIITSIATSVTGIMIVVEEIPSLSDFPAALVPLCGSVVDLCCDGLSLLSLSVGFRSVVLGVVVLFPKL